MLSKIELLIFFLLVIVLIFLDHRVFDDLLSLDFNLSLFLFRILVNFFVFVLFIEDD